MCSRVAEPRSDEKGERNARKSLGDETTSAFLEVGETRPRSAAFKPLFTCARCLRAFTPTTSASGRCEPRWLQADASEAYWTAIEG